MFFKLLGNKRGFTLVEVVICMMITFIAGLSTVGAILYARRSLEMDKQRLAAMNYCREAMERAMTLQDSPEGTRELAIFNNPSIGSISANLSVEYYAVNLNGTVDWSNRLSTPHLNRPTYIRTTVNWIPTGLVARPQSYSLQGLITRGLI